MTAKRTPPRNLVAKYHKLKRNEISDAINERRIAALAAYYRRVEAAIKRRPGEKEPLAGEVDNIVARLKIQPPEAVQ